MGGNLFSNTRRVTASEYVVYEENVISYLNSIGIKAHKIPYFKSKETFGDLDLIISTNDVPNLKNCSLQSHKTSNGCSFVWEDIQVDLLYSTPTKIDSNIHYFSYNDLHNLIGKVARSLSCKLGNEGLYYSFKNPWSGAIKEIFLTDNWEQIYTFLDYEYSEYLKGFDTLEDIYKFVISSKYFNAGRYSLDQLRHRDRVRDKKRETYQKFIKFIEDNNLSTLVEYRSYEDTVLNVEEFFYQGDRVIQYKILHNIFKECDNHYYKQKFNGDIIREVTDLGGKELASFMKYFRNKYDKEYILSHGGLHIKNLISSEYERFKTT